MRLDDSFIEFIIAPLPRTEAEKEASYAWNAMQKRAADERKSKKAKRARKTDERARREKQGLDVTSFDDDEDD
ncbi:hypothetical protein ACP4OV_012364 [Aristida adscensionis]